MAEALDGKSIYDYFMDNVSRIQSDQHFRDVMRELDEGQNETLSLLASDPAAFLRYRGIQLPEDFRVAVKKKPHDVARPGNGGDIIIICHCIEICFLRYCAIYCSCSILR